MAIKLYVLKLQNNKYYIGTTERTVHERFKEHCSGKGSEWTKLYEPIEIVEEMANPDAYDEDKITKKYMDNHGINNVRGGSYTEINLPDYQIKSLEKELCTSHNKCYRCLRIGHFANNCGEKKDINGNIIDDLVWCCDYCDKEFATEKDALKHEMDHHKNYKQKNKDRCYKCGNFGHWAKDCFVTKYKKKNYWYNFNSDSDSDYNSDSDDD